MNRKIKSDMNNEKELRTQDNESTVTTTTTDGSIWYS